MATSILIIFLLLIRNRPQNCYQNKIFIISAYNFFDILQLDRTQDIIVAYMYNGKLLEPDHGYPVRIIIPGYVGGRMIKWMTDIDLIDTICQDYYHFFDNR